MKEAFLEFVRRGEAMTKEDVARIMRWKPEYVRRHSKPPLGFIPRSKGRLIRFDPERMIEVFCTPPPKKADDVSSLKIKSESLGHKPIERKDLWL